MSKSLEFETTFKGHTIRAIDWIGNEPMPKYTGEIEYPNGEYGYFESNTYQGILDEIEMAKKHIAQENA